MGHINTLAIGEIHEEAVRLLSENTKLQEIDNKSFQSVLSFPEVEAVVLRTFTTFKQEEIKKFPKLKYLVSCSVGTDNLDLEALQKKGIKLIHIPGTNADSVAEHTLSLISGLTVSLNKKTVGILGFGHIGKLVARKLSKLPCKILAFDVIEQDPALLKELGVQMKSMEGVVMASDIVTVHVPLNKYTENLINAKLFEKMRNKVMFINTSRAKVVDEKALMGAYRKGKFSGIGLDVCSDTLKKELSGKEHVIVTNHIAAQSALREMCIKPVQLFLKKQRSN